MMQRLTHDGVPFKLTMSITPTLCAMLQDQVLCERYVRHLDLLIDLAARERKRNRKHPQLCGLAEFYIGLFSETRRHFVDEWKCDLLSIFFAEQKGNKPGEKPASLDIKPERLEARGNPVVGPLPIRTGAVRLLTSQISKPAKYAHR